MVRIGWALLAVLMKRAGMLLIYHDSDKAKANKLHFEKKMVSGSIGEESRLGPVIMLLTGILSMKQKMISK
jgi:hypothetical protein